MDLGKILAFRVGSFLFENGLVLLLLLIFCLAPLVGELFSVLLRDRLASEISKIEAKVTLRWSSTSVRFSRRHTSTLAYQGGFWG